MCDCIPSSISRLDRIAAKGIENARPQWHGIFLSNRSQNRTREEHRRIGDHICCISGLGQLRSYFPERKLEWPLLRIFEETLAAVRKRPLSQIRATVIHRFHTTYSSPSHTGTLTWRSGEF
jgi:hypothetical protein